MSHPVATTNSSFVIPSLPRPAISWKMISRRPGAFGAAAWAAARLVSVLLWGRLFMATSFAAGGAPSGQPVV
jgi:hypothetical protein